MAMPAALRRLGPLLSVFLAPSISGCTQEPREVPPPDCSVDAEYEFHPIYLPSGDPNNPELGNWYASGDRNAQVNTKPAVESQAYANYEEFTGDICGHTVGKHFTFGFNHDWGAVGGRWLALAGADADASDYEGFSFWGLSLYDRSIELNLSDVHSFNPATTGEIPATCIPDVIPETGNTVKANNPDFVDENGVPRANSCGSLFSRRVLMDKSWKLYTIPFSDFIQIYRDPRFKPGGLETSAMRQFSFRVPKDSFVDVTFVNMAWYRKARN